MTISLLTWPYKQQKITTRGRTEEKTKLSINHAAMQALVGWRAHAVGKRTCVKKKKSNCANHKKGEQWKKKKKEKSCKWKEWKQQLNSAVWPCKHWSATGYKHEETTTNNNNNNQPVWKRRKADTQAASRGSGGNNHPTWVPVAEILAGSTCVRWPCKKAAK